MALAAVMAHGCNIGSYTMSQLTRGISYKQLKRVSDWQQDDSEIVLNPELVTEIVDVFSSWSDLTHSEKRDLMRQFQMRIFVVRPERGVLKVDRLELGVFPSGNVIYKKMKRLGIE